MRNPRPETARDPPASVGRQAGATLQPTGQGAAPGAEQDNSTALQQRFTALQEQSHSQSFEAWMRSRNTENMVVTTETLMQDKANIAEDSYEKVRLPKVRATTIVKNAGEHAAVAQIVC